jgi:hypothetical protein
MRSILSLGVATELAVTAFQRALLHHHKEDGDENQNMNGGCNHSADNRGAKEYCRRWAVSPDRLEGPLFRRRLSLGRRRPLSIAGRCPRGRK